MIGDAPATDAQGRRVPCARVTLSILELLDGEAFIDDLPPGQDIASEGVDVDVCRHIVLARGGVGLWEADVCLRRGRRVDVENRSNVAKERETSSDDVEGEEGGRNAAGWTVL